jgi:hypothetical protein
MATVVGLNRRKVWLKSELAFFCVAFAASSAWAGQIGHGAATPQVSHQQFSSSPFPSGGPAFPVGAPPVPGYNYHYGSNSSYHGNFGNYGGRGYRGSAFGYYVMPYYYPVDNSAYGYDYVGGEGPDLYSGPPIGPNDSLHMIAEQPPVDPYAYGPPDAPGYAEPPVAAVPPAPAPEPPKPGEPVVLVFRNGHQQEVTNYAIMGDSLYVFDQGRKKIALADLDLPATQKANDDRGIEFNVPAASKKKPTTTTTPAPQSGTPEQSTGSPPNVAAVMP